LGHFNIRIPLAVATRATIYGHIGGLFFWTLIGQTMGRQFVLQKARIQPAIVAVLISSERIILMVLSVLLAFSGAILLVGNDAVISYAEKFPIFQIMTVSIIGLFMWFYVGRTRFEIEVISKISMTNLYRYISEIGLITLLNLFLMLTTFVIVISVYAPNISLVYVYSAAAIISFAASIPISFNGWGIREIASVYILGLLDINFSDALAASLIIGVCSTLAILISSPYLIFKQKHIHYESNINNDVISQRLFYEKSAVWALTIATTVAIFFQIHVEVPGFQNIVNINMADPFAIFSLTIILQSLIKNRSFPSWRYPEFNKSIGIISVILVFGFLVGLNKIGITPWALGSRLFGWIVILGYISTGYLVVSYLGMQGLRRFSDLFISMAVIIITLQISLRLGIVYEVDLGAVLTPRFEGYSSNRNAFAFQLLIVLSFVLAYSSGRFKVHQKNILLNYTKIRIAILCLIFTGIVLTGSRAGLGTCIILLACIYLKGATDKKILSYGILSSMLLLVLLNILYLIGSDSGNVIFGGNEFIENQQYFNRAHSDSERWLSITKGIELWINHPIFGAGLGVFIEESKEWADAPLVIHSTPIWILAEFGIIGLLIFGILIVNLIRFLFEWKTALPAHQFLSSLVIIFLVFSLVHEIFFQRMFWLVLGAVLASPMKEINNNLGTYKQ